MADNLTTFMCRLSWNLGASVSWNPQDLSRTVMGLFYLYMRHCCTHTYTHTHTCTHTHTHICTQHWVTGDNGGASGFTCIAWFSQRSKNSGEKMVSNSQIGVTRIIYVRLSQKKRRYHTNTNIQRNNYAYRYEKKMFIGVSQLLKNSHSWRQAKLCWHSNCTVTAAVSDVWTGDKKNNDLKVTVIPSLWSLRAGKTPIRDKS